MRVRKLRGFKQADEPAFRGLDALCFPNDVPLINNSNYHWWIMSDADGAPVGYAGLWVIYDEATFCRVGILETYRGKGLQKQLIKARIAWCRRNDISIIYSYTVNSNKSSRKNLRRCGFDARKSKIEKIYSHKLILKTSQ